MSEEFQKAQLRDARREADNLNFLLAEKQQRIDALELDNARLKDRLAECRRSWKEND